MVVFPEPDGAENTINFPFITYVLSMSVILNLFQDLNIQILKQVQNDKNYKTFKTCSLIFSNSSFI